jgi:RluA family pseudouridine synthase
MIRSANQNRPPVANRAAACHGDILSEWIVDAESAGKRLDRTAAEHADEFPSRKAAYKAAKKQRLLVNGEPAAPNAILKTGDRVSVRSPEKPPDPLDLPLDVHFEDDILAVVTKPPGIPTSGNYARTLARALPANLSPSPRADTLPAPHPVHRLDSPTGGLLLVAKTAGAAMALGQQFETGTVTKRYRAILVGRLTPETDTIELELDGKPSHTDYRVVEYSRSLSVGWLTLVDLFPRTGRTHQLRQHMAGRGNPILGDRSYGKGHKILRGKGLFLWAVELTFTHPESGDAVTCITDAPPKFKTYIMREKRRYDEKSAD